MTDEDNTFLLGVFGKKCCLFCVFVLVSLVCFIFSFIFCLNRIFLFLNFCPRTTNRACVMVFFVYLCSRIYNELLAAYWTRTHTDSMHFGNLISEIGIGHTLRISFRIQFVECCSQFLFDALWKDVKWRNQCKGCNETHWLIAVAFVPVILCFWLWKL